MCFLLPFPHRGLRLSRQADRVVGRRSTALRGAGAGIAAHAPQPAVEAPGTSEPITPERAALLLNALGYHADVRTFRVHADVQLRTVAVYVNKGDPRIVWSRGKHQVPLEFLYRLNDRTHGDVTLFSGAEPLDAGRFLNALATQDAGPLLPADLDGPPRAEWNPFQLPEQERREVEDLVRSILSAFCFDPAMLTADPSQPIPLATPVRGIDRRAARPLPTTLVLKPGS